MVVIAITFPNRLAMERLDHADLPANWDYPAARDETKKMGTAWARRNRTAILSVPSSIVPNERNYLLNPRHADFRKIRFGQPQEFRFDPRLK
jgi:RES domain-containing protein